MAPARIRTTLDHRVPARLTVRCCLMAAGDGGTVLRVWLYVLESVRSCQLESRVWNDHSRMTPTKIALDIAWQNARIR